MALWTVSGILTRLVMMLAPRRAAPRRAAPGSGGCARESSLGDVTRLLKTLRRC